MLWNTASAIRFSDTAGDNNSLVSPGSALTGDCRHLTPWLGAVQKVAVQLTNGQNPRTRHTLLCAEGVFLC